MGARQVATLAVATLAALAATPSLALDTYDSNSVRSSVPLTMFYVRIPLGATTVKEKAPVYGLAFQGRTQYETVNVDTRLASNLVDALAGIEGKWLIVGGVAVAAGAAVALKNKNRSDNYNNNQNNQQNSAPTNGGGGSSGSDPNKPCPLPGDPCHK